MFGQPAAWESGGLRFAIRHSALQLKAYDIISDEHISCCKENQSGRVAANDSQPIAHSFLAPLRHRPIGGRHQGQSTRLGCIQMATEQAPIKMCSKEICPHSGELRRVAFAERRRLGIGRVQNGLKVALRGRRHRPCLSELSDYLCSAAYSSTVHRVHRVHRVARRVPCTI